MDDNSIYSFDPTLSDTGYGSDDGYSTSLAPDYYDTSLGNVTGSLYDASIPDTDASTSTSSLSSLSNLGSETSSIGNTLSSLLGGVAKIVGASNSSPSGVGTVALPNGQTVPVTSLGGGIFGTSTAGNQLSSSLNSVFGSLATFLPYIIIGVVLYLGVKLLTGKK